MKKRYPKINGKLKCWIEAPTKDEPHATMMIYGDVQGLKSFARVIEHLAEYNQENDLTIPVGEKEHCSISQKFLLKGSDDIIVGRLDPKKKSKGKGK